MASYFYPGQKLTAQSLNDAIAGAKGPANPTKDFKWRSVGIGDLYMAWSEFSNRQDFNIQPLQVGICIDPLQQPLTWNSYPVNALRRIFINLGPTAQQINKVEQHKGPFTWFDLSPIGSFNAVPWLGIVGWQHHYPTSIYQPNTTNFSMWMNTGSLQPSNDTPAEWTRVQKLYENDVARNCNNDGWWWTGMTVEACAFDWIRLTWPINLVVYPLMVDVVYNSASETKHETTLPFLCVSTEMDYQMKSILLASKSDEIMRLVSSHYSAIFNVEAKNIWFIDDPNLVQPLANNNSNSQTTNTQYLQLTHKVDMAKEWGGSKPVDWLNSLSLRMGVVQWIGKDGKHHSMQPDVKDLYEDGGETQKEPGNRVLDCTCVSMAALKSTGEVATRWSIVDWPKIVDEEDDPVHAALSASWPDLMGNASISANYDYRLLAVNQPGAQGWQWYDLCPDFSTGETPDSGISASCLSSIQEKDIELVSEEGQETQSQKLWSLWEFDNFENSKTYTEIQDNLSSYDLVVRHIDKRGEDTVGIVEYVHLSSLELSGGNLPDADVPAAGLSSIQTRTLDGGSKVLELYNFHDPAVETVYLSAQSRYDFIVRDNQDHCVKYADLSGIGGEVTLSGTDGSSSTGSKWKFEAFSNSNISVHISPQTIQMGVYYI